MNFCACTNRMVKSSSGTAAAAASSSLGGYWNRLQILVVMVWKPAGSAKIAGHVIQRVGNEDEHKGERVAGDDKDDSGQRIDVEQMRVGLGPRQQAIKLVEQAAV